MPPKLETEKYTVLVDRRIGGKRREVDDVVDLARGTADHLVASGVVELAADTPARKAREAEAAKAAAEAEAAKVAAEVEAAKAAEAEKPAEASEPATTPAAEPKA